MAAFLELMSWLEVLAKALLEKWGSSEGEMPDELVVVFFLVEDFGAFLVVAGGAGASFCDAKT